MRAVLIGASGLAIATAKLLLEGGHEVILIEKDSDRTDLLAEELDCGVVCGDGSRPSILQEVGPEQSDVLFCLSSSDQDNIIAALVGRKLGFDRVIAHIQDPDYESICAELDIDDMIIPDQVIGKALVGMTEGEESAALSSYTSGGLRFFDFVATKENAGKVSGLELPEGSRVIALTTDEKSRIADDDSEIKPEDKVLILTTDDDIETLRDRFK